MAQQINPTLLPAPTLASLVENREIVVTRTDIKPDDIIEIIQDQLDRPYSSAEILTMTPGQLRQAVVEIYNNVYGDDTP